MPHCKHVPYMLPGLWWLTFLGMFRPFFSVNWPFVFLRHRVYRVAMATFRRTFRHEDKIRPSWWWLGGARPPPFTISTITSKGAVYTTDERADTLPLFLLYPCMYSMFKLKPFLISHIFCCLIYLISSFYSVCLPPSATSTVNLSSRVVTYLLFQFLLFSHCNLNQVNEHIVQLSR
jgi:hypothetical protein